MYFSFEQSINKGDGSYFFKLTVGPNPSTIEEYARRVFAGIGLKNVVAIQAFDNFIGEAFFRRFINEANADADVVKAVKNPNGKLTDIKVHVSRVLSKNLSFLV